VIKEKMTTPIIFDGRNMFNPETMGQLGFRYHSIGRSSVTPR
jgi:UDPglucose 6-dehydrogenase